MATVLPNINQSPFVLNEITNAVNAGFEVITHTDVVSVPGWSGAGYIILDAETGDGVYKIESGGNGAFFSGFFLGLAISAMFIAIGASFNKVRKIPGVDKSGLVATVLIESITFIGQIVLPVYLYNMEEFGKKPDELNCFRLGMTAGIAVSGLLAVLKDLGAANALGSVSAGLILNGFTTGELLDTKPYAECGFSFANN